MGYEIDFMSVGQGEGSGDAIALRFGNLFGKPEEYKVVVIDGGFKESGGEQLVAHIRKYYKTPQVDIAISTHPDSDHSAGLQVVLEELRVKRLWMHRPWEHTQDIARTFKDGRVTDESVREALKKSLDDALDLEELALSKGIPIDEPFTGVIDETKSLYVIGPTKEFYESLLPGFRGTPEPKEGIFARYIEKAQEYARKVMENWDIETLKDDGETSAENNTSTILLLGRDNQFSLFTSDAGIPALNEAIKILKSIGFDFSKLGFIQVPHHGSQRNIGPTILNTLIGPRLREDKRIKAAFVSVANGNDPKHPSKKVTNALRRRGAPVHATQGWIKWHHFDAPGREGWIDSIPLPFYSEVED